MSVHSVPTRVLAVAGWLYCAFFALNLVMTGTLGVIRHFLPGLLLVVWGIYLLLWRPRLLVEPGGLVVVNILRDHRIPFAALKAVRVAQNVSLDTTAGRIGSWGAPGAGKLGPRRGPGRSGTLNAPVLSQAQAILQQAWDAWERAQADAAATGRGAGTPPDAEPAPGVGSRWNVPGVVVTLVLVALTAAGSLV